MGNDFFPFEMACSASTCFLLGEGGKYVYSFLSLVLEIFLGEMVLGQVCR